jgi:hypothetical protein
MNANPSSPTRQRSEHRFQKALGVQLMRHYQATASEPTSEAYLRLLADADRIALLKAPRPQASTTPHSRLTLFK